MQVSKRWRIWLGICVAVTAPLLVRDLYQITSNPPVLHDRLPSSPPVFVDSRDIAVFPNNMSAQLLEVYAPVPGGYAGWTPKDDLLPETLPTHQMWEEEHDRYGGKVPANKRPYRFTVKVCELPRDTLQVAITDESGVPADGSTTTIGQDGFGTPLLTNWLLLPRESVATDVYVGFARAADRRILTQIPRWGESGMSFGEKSRWLASPDGYMHPLEIELPASRRPRVADQYFLEISELDALGNMRVFNQSTVSVTPTTERLRVSVNGSLGEGHDARAIRVTLTPFRWTRFADAPLTILDSHRARLQPLPIFPEVEQIRRLITDSPDDSAFYEVVYATRQEMSHPQVARHVPDSVVIAVNSKDADSLSDPSGSYVHVYLPKKWGANYARMALTVTTRHGEQVEATRYAFEHLTDGKGFRATFLLNNVSVGDVDSILFGIRH